MPRVLACKPGSTGAIKVGVAAAISGTEIELRASDQLLYTDTEGGIELRAANAVARLLCNASLQPAGSDTWLDWEEAELRPTLQSSSEPRIQRACQHLAASLAAPEHLLPGGFSIADIALVSTLRPHAQRLSPALNTYISSVRSRADFQQGVELALPDSTLASAQEHSLAAAGAGPSLPVPGQQNVLITSALPYVNNVPHLGNIIGCVLSADVYARYCRARGVNTCYVCGTDEYGTATETKALEEGLTCQEICDKYHAEHKAIYEWFQISFDHFGRTPTWQQTEIAQGIFEQLRQQGRLKEQTTQQLFSEAANTFLADRFVSGTCPYPDCAFEDARGDQCDKCGRLMNPTELRDPRCKLTGTRPVLRETSHFFIDLPGLTPQLQAYHDRTSHLGGWSSNCVQVTNAWMRDGLKLRSVTRDLKWGTPVPVAGYENKVFYVWFDAPIGYVSITANLTPDWQQWWHNPDNVDLVQFMGKDNVPFHTVIFPATQLGTGQAWTLMKGISVTEYLTYEGAKFSKRNGVGVFGNDTRDTGIPVEVWRFYLLSNRPEAADSDFKWSDFVAKNNNELLGNLGNFVHRALSFAHARFDKAVPQVHASKGAQALEGLGREVGPLVQQYVAAMDRIKMREALRLAMTISSTGNRFIQENELWVLAKRDLEECGSLLAACLGLVLLLAALLQPFVPSLSSKILGLLNLPASAAQLSDEFIASASHPEQLLPPGHRLPEEKPTVLVGQISEEEGDLLRQRFSGTQSSRSAAAASSASSAAPAASKAKPSEASGAKAKAPKAAKAAKAAADSGSSQHQEKQHKGSKSEQKAQKAGKASKAGKAEQHTENGHVRLAEQEHKAAEAAAASN